MNFEIVNLSKFKIFILGILIISVWKSSWEILTNLIGVKYKNNIILLLFSLVAIYLIDGKIKLH
tara:strand:- start:78 stop:269 length:192 start_codon:yes stop_codon:yes gene_type:complete